MARFAYFGGPYVARDTLKRLVTAGYVPSVVVTTPDAPKGRGLELTPSATKVWAQAHGIPVLAPTALDEAFLEEIAPYSLEYGIAVAYGKIIPLTVIDSFPKGILNVHYSLLPKYRGASPVEAALLHGDEVTGVTVQQMVFELDAGDILAQRELSILPDDTTLTLRPRLIEAGATLLIDTLPPFLDGTISHTLQDPAYVSRAPKIRKEEGRLSLGDDPHQNWLKYRAYKESPGTYFFAEKDGRQIRVKVADAAYENGAFVVKRIVPEGRAETGFEWLSQAGWRPL